MTQEPHAAAPMPDDPERARIVNRLKRLEGQVRGLQTMIASGQDCDGVLTQVMAAKSALNQVGLRIIGYSMRTCILRDDGRSKEEIADETLAILMRFADLPGAWTADDAD
jgi:DNA-binding FrmR family transcriptional regulator